MNQTQPPSTAQNDPGALYEPDGPINPTVMREAVRTLLRTLPLNDLTGEHRDVALAIHQLSELGVLLVGQMMDREAPLP